VGLEKNMKDSEPERQLAAALGRVPSGLFVLTIRQDDAETGMLLSWVQQCSFDPPQVTLALKRGRWLGDLLTVSATFVLNLLDEAQTDMVAHFGKGFLKGEPAFTDVAVERINGQPVLTEALAYLECRVTARHPVGDHDLIIAQVVSGKMLNDGQPMVHVRKSGLHY
jgi:flavin reductase (DIM6/NTAB) family NADH-FMN oxidoreductase RutF